MNTSTELTIGSRVEFREDSPQHEANKGIVYTVVPSPSGNLVSIDKTRDANGTNAYPDGGGVPREYVWLVDSRDADKAPSRQRRRTGYVTALRVL